MAEFNIKNPEINKMLSELTDDGRQEVADLIEKDLKERRTTDEINGLKKQVEELKKENVELQHTLSVHNFLDTGVPQERLDYQRDLKKEIIKLRSLCRRASEKIRYLDDMIIKSIEDNKVIEYPEEDKTDSAGFSSINLLNRLDGTTNGGYVENYDDLNLEMKTLNNNHPPDCKWHKDWHACDCGAFDDGGNTPERVEEQIEWLKKVAEEEE